MRVDFGSPCLTPVKPGISSNLAGRSSWHAFRQQPKQRRSRQQLRPHADLTAGFLEAVASAALKARLRQHSLVQAHIDCDGFSLLAGRVNSVAIAGRDWLSPLGLSARILDISLGPASLDVPAILSQQRILLLGVPQGAGRIAFTAQQFGVFLQHPLMVEAAARAVQGNRFRFDPGTVRYDLVAGTIFFSGVWDGDQRRYQMEMQAGSNSAPVRPARQQAGNGDAGDSAAAMVAADLTAFFSRLTLDLQGPELSFASMELVPGDVLPSRPGVLPPALQRQLPPTRQQNTEAVLDLRLSVKVYGFPPPELGF